MGLTSVGDIAVLYKKIERLEFLLLTKEDQLRKEVDRLQRSVFKGEILLEKDTSWEIVRKKRDYLLESTDWTMTPGSTVDQSAWSAYRQILRDLPQTFKSSNLNAIRWPKQPAVSGPNTIVDKK